MRLEGLFELSKAETQQIYGGGSPFYQLGTWVGKGLEAIVDLITTPGYGVYPDHPSYL